MEELFKWLDGNPWFNIVFLALAIISIIVSIFLYFRARKEKVPLYNIRHFNLVREHLRTLEKVQITYDGQEVKDLTLTRFALWNKGRDTINRSDMAPADPLRLEVPSDAQILQANLDFVYNPANNFSINLSDDKTRLLIDFDYFHTYEGCTITLYHTSSGNEVQLKGTVKGAGKIKKGVVEENEILFSVLNSTIGKVFPDEKRLKLGILGKILITPILLPIGVPILIFVLPIELVMRLVRRSPPQFKLEDSE